MEEAPSPADVSEPPSLGRRISELRAEQGWTLVELHHQSRVSVSYLSQLEHDAALPARETVRQIAEVLEPAQGHQLIALRDRLELERLGFDRRAAQLLVELEQLGPETLELLGDPEVRRQIVDLLASPS